MSRTLFDVPEGRSGAFAPFMWKEPHPDHTPHLTESSRRERQYEMRDSFDAAIPTAYQEAAEALIEAALERKTLWNLSAIPILFLVRQSVETHLKAVLSLAARSGDDLSEPGKEHDLQELFGAIVKYLESRWPEELASDEFLQLKLNIALLHAVDKSSTTFRYADAKLKLPDEVLARTHQQYGVDLLTVRDVSREIFSYLEGIWTCRIEERNVEEASWGGE